MPARDEKPGETEREIQGSDPRRYYEQRREHYRDASIAVGYDARRFGGARARRDAAKWRAICRALDRAGDAREILDLPTGTGRFVGRLVQRGCSVVGADLSREMLAVARGRGIAASGLKGLVQAAAERLPFRDGAFDCAMSIRFFLHLTPEVRVTALRELARVSRRWVIADYRHRGSLRNVLRRAAHALRLVRVPPLRVSRREVEADAAAAGLRVVEVFVVTPLLSDKWVVLCEKLQGTA